MRKSQLFTIQKQFHFTFYRNWIENTKQKPANVSKWKISEIKRLNNVCTRGDKSVYLWRRCVDDQIAMCRRRLLQRKQQSCYCTLTCNVWKKKLIREIVTKCLKSNEQKKKPNQIFKYYHGTHNDANRNGTNQPLRFIFILLNYSNARKNKPNSQLCVVIDRIVYRLYMCNR